VPESARIVIEEENTKGSRALPWVDFDMFQRLCFARQMKFESALKDGGTAFLDRGVVDQLAYYKLNGRKPPEEISEAASKKRYDGIFLLDVLPVYQTDEARKEDPQTAEWVHQRTMDTYLELGYEPVRVPPLSVQERIDFILSRV
jgi:predicted ATPase